MIYFCKHTTPSTQCERGRHMFYSPSTRRMGNRTGWLPTHLKKTFLKETTEETSLIKISQFQISARAQQSYIFIHVNCPRINPGEKNPKCTHKSDGTYFLNAILAQGQTPVSLFSFWIFKATIGFHARPVIYGFWEANGKQRSLTSGQRSRGSKTTIKSTWETAEGSL